MMKKIMIGVAAYRGMQCIPCLDSIEIMARLLLKNGFDVCLKLIEGDPYIQAVRNKLIETFMSEGHDIFFSIDDDISFPAEVTLEFVNKEDEFVAGIYPMKTEPLNWPVVLYTDPKGYPKVRGDGYIAAARVPAGFFCLKRSAIEKMYKNYEFRTYYEMQTANGSPEDEKCPKKKIYDLFPQGLDKKNTMSDYIQPLKSSGVWIGEDFAFCDLWTNICGQIWVKPDITFTHYRFKNNKYEAYRGNYHEYLKKLPKE
jgi:hypothetical protein